MSISLLKSLCLLCFAGGLLISQPAEGRRKKKEPVREISPEEQFVADHFPLRTPLEWKKGERFLFVGDRIDLTFRPDRFYGAYSSDGDFRNARFVFEGVEEERDFGTGMQAVLRFGRNGCSFRFDTRKTIEELRAQRYYPLIPDLISLTDIAKADSLLRGKTLYIKTALWYDTDGVRQNGRKLVPVVVERVEPGTFVLPAKIVFRAGSESPFHTIFVRLVSRMNSGENLTFDRVFSFTDPRLRYPDIPADRWELITREQVTEGMTMQECRLALGSPVEVNRVPTYTGWKEQWYYSGGRFLFFEEGLLSRFRN